MSSTPVHPFTSSAFVLGCALALPFTAHAQSEVAEHQRLQAPYAVGTTNNDPGFGKADLSGNTFMVGAPLAAFDDGRTLMQSVGAVYVYTRSRSGRPWGLDGELRPSDASTNLFFGTQVCLDGDTAAISSTGAVYVFQRVGSVWTQTQRIPRSVLSRAMSLDGNTLAIGEWSATVAGHANAGAVAVYRRSGSTWSHEADLTDPTPAANDGLGKHLDVTEGRVVAYSVNTTNGSANPTAHVFARGSGGVWRYEAGLRPDWQTGGVLNSYFRLSSIDISGSTILIQGGSRVGIFTRSGSTWTQTQTINKQVWGFQSADFYQDLEDDLFVVSSMRRVQDTHGHLALVFRRIGSLWVKQFSLTTSDGFPIAMPQVDGDTAVMVWADAVRPCAAANPPTCSIGAAYVYDLTRLPVEYGFGCAGATLQQFGIDAVPDFAIKGEATSHGHLDFFVENAPPGSVAFVMVGVDPAYLPLGGGCALQVDALSEYIGPIALSGALNEPAGTGRVRYRVELPEIGSGEVTVQGVVLDPASRNGLFTVTQPAVVTIR